MSSVSVDPKKGFARLFLSRAREDLERAKRTRIAYVKAAHDVGLSNVEIASELGVSEARIRQILRAA